MHHLQRKNQLGAGTGAIALPAVATRTPGLPGQGVARRELSQVVPMVRRLGNLLLSGVGWEVPSADPRAERNS